ncbi:MAG: YqeG family HAD IIIA-type phosphatase [Clostridia bacterium]|nr:YqeG family HAD IIIA-type phosphatase [Clostridia bacterium]
MVSLLFPDWHVSSIASIDPVELQKRGIKGIVFDLDNTIITWGSRSFSPQVMEWFSHLKKMGFHLCILSNNTSGRVRGLARVLGVPAIPRAVKPRKKAFKKALRILGTSPEETAVIGDQIFTDILGGNRLGLYTILVFPMSRKEFIGTKMVRKLERFVLKKKGINAKS